MPTTAGRASRVGAGLPLVLVGAFFGGPLWVLVAVRLLPIAAGLPNFRLLALLFHAPLRATAPHS
jgi:hypothetical protein